MHEKGLCFPNSFTHLNLALEYKVHLFKFSDFYGERSLTSPKKKGFTQVHCTRKWRIISQDVRKTNLNYQKHAVQLKEPHSWFIIHTGHMAQELLIWTL